MDAVGDVTFFLKKRFSYNQSMHNREDAVFFIIILFHLGAIWKKLTDSGVSFARHCRFMGAHHGVQTAVQKHIKKRLFGWNARNASRYLTWQLNPLYASGPLCATGEPADRFRFYAEVLLQRSP